MVYMVRCKRGAYYTGMTRDVLQRVKDHNAGKGAKALRALGLPVRLVWTYEVDSHSQALRLEHRIKQLKRADKVRLAGGTSLECL